MCKDDLACSDEQATPLRALGSNFVALGMESDLKGRLVESDQKSGSAKRDVSLRHARTIVCPLKKNT